LALGEGPTVAVVGTHLSRELRRHPGPTLEEAERQLSGHLSSLNPGAADLILLPESMIPVPLHDPQADALRGVLEVWARFLQATLVVGALDLEEGGAHANAPTNSAVLFSPEGLTPQRYNKVQLVPVMESGIFRRGGSIRPLSWRDVDYGPLICYESLFGGLSRRHRQGGAQVLLNLTSDVWFGDDQGWLRGIFLDQHPAHLALRAVENRVSVARAANGGYSFLLDPRGRRLSPLVPPRGGVSVATLPVYYGTTLFTRYGDLLGPASALILLALLLWSQRPRVGDEGPLSA
jgi:apolipoprotein N-acyltransferase